MVHHEKILEDNIVKVNRKLIGLAIASLIASSMGMPSYAADNTAAVQKTQIESVVRDYILKNPEVVVQSLQGYQQKQMEQTQKTFQKIQDMAPKFADRIFRQNNDPIAGNPNGTVTLVEFSDYQCPHCLDMSPVVDNLIKKNPNLRVVFKEFPIRGPLSETAAKAVLAAQKQGKYYEFRKGLMLSKPPLTEEGIYKLAQSVGIDVNKLKTDMNDGTIAQQIKDNYKLAQDLQLIYTPVFFVAKTNVNSSAGPNAVIFIPGGVGEDQLNEAITKISS